MGRRSEGEFWSWARLAWDKPLAAVATFVLGALFYGPLPNSFEALARSYALSADNPYVRMVATSSAGATVHLLPLIQGLAMLLMAIAAVAGIKHLYRRARPAHPEAAILSRSPQFSQINRRRRRTTK